MERVAAVKRHAEEMAAYRASQKLAPTPAPVAKPITPAIEAKPEPKPKATRKPRRVKTPIVIVDTLAPISGISALPGIPLPSPTATCAVSRPAPTPNVQAGTGVEKIASAAIERETLNDRELMDLRQRAKEVGVTGAIGKMKADTLRARIAIQEEKLANKPVAVAAPVKTAPAPAPAPSAKPHRVNDFVETLADGRKLYIVVYSDDSIVTEIKEASASRAA